jgi:hypothetical protein
MGMSHPSLDYMENSLHDIAHESMQAVHLTFYESRLRRQFSAYYHDSCFDTSSF